MSNKTHEGSSATGAGDIPNSLNRYFVVLIDASTPDDDKMWQSFGVLACDEHAAIEIAQTHIERECGDGYFPLLTFNETELSKLVDELAKTDLSKKKPLIYL